MGTRTRDLIFGLAALALVGAEAQAVEYARPDGPVSAGTWTASGAGALFEMIDEVTANDATDFIESSADSTAEVSLSNVADPGVDTGHVIRYRSMAERSATTVEVALYQGPDPGATLIATTGAQAHAANNNWELPPKAV